MSVTHSTHLGKFTVMPAETMELCQPIQITPDGQTTNGNGQNIPDYFCPTEGERDKGRGGEEEWGGHLEEKGEQTVLLRRLLKADVDVLHCP